MFIPLTCVLVQRNSARCLSLVQYTAPNLPLLKPSRPASVDAWSNKWTPLPGQPTRYFQVLLTRPLAFFARFCLDKPRPPPQPPYRLPR